MLKEMKIMLSLLTPTMEPYLNTELAPPAFWLHLDLGFEGM